MVTRVVKMEFEEKFVETFKNIFKNVQNQIANFKGCSGVKLLQHESNKSIFFTISTWESASHLEDYRQSALFSATWAKVKPHFIVKAEAWSLLEK